MKKLFLTVMMAAVAALGYSQPYWSYSFSGGSLADGSGNDDLTQTGSALTIVPDRFSSTGDAVSLNGDVLEGGNVSPTAPVTMSYAFWIKDAVNDANERIIIDHFGTVSFGNSIRLLNGNIKVVGRPGYFNGNSWVPSYSVTQFLTSTTNVADGDWHHVVVNVAQRGNQPQITDYELYVDGSLEDSGFANELNTTAQLYRPYRTPSPFLIGDNVAGSDRYENTIDDINFYTADLSPAQVTTLFNVRPPQVVYVDQDATGASDGSSWADAFTDLQSALSYATVPGDKLWIAEGVYKPDASDRQVFFTLPADMEVYGGFNGTETQLSQRDWHTYETIISGDLQGNDNSNVTYNEATRSDNSYRLFIVSGNGVVLDGLVLESAQGNWTSSVAFSRGSAITKGAGVSNLVLRNSTFRKNVARIGIINFNFTTTVTNNILIESCDFHNNFAIYGAGLSSATNEAGAVTDIEVYNSRFFNNEAGDIPGGTGFSGSSMSLFANEGTINATIVNNTFAYNQDNGTELQDAGTIILRRLDNSASDVTNLELHNNIFFGNTKAGNPNSVAIGLMNRQNNDITSVNLSNNVIDYGTLANRSVSITPSGLQDDSDPDFVDGPNGDLRLTSTSWVIDAGDNTKLPVSITKDVDGEDRILNSTIDIGAHEFDPSICNPPVAINTQPDDESVCAGDNVTLSVAAVGNNVTYQWQLDGVDISGATSNSLTLNSVAQNDAGDYTVVVSDACNDVTSSVASLSLAEETDITLVVLGPTDVCEGGDFTTPDLASSTQGDNLSYQWSYDGVQLNGETGTALNLTNLQLSDAGTYSVVATGTCGTDQLSFPVTVTESTAITSQPSDETLCAGDDASFSVSANGSNLSYQWKLDGTNLSGETSATLNVNGVSAGDAGNYTVEVTGDCGTETSNVAALTVNPSTAISSQPSDETLCAGDDATLSVTATGDNLSYQWVLGSLDINGETTATLELTNVGGNDAGPYTVEVTGTCGTVTSDVATVQVFSNTAITQQPSDITACEGTGNNSFQVIATGTNVDYQWYQDGVALVGEISSVLNLGGPDLSEAGIYTVDVIGACGTVTSDAATLTVNEETVITAQPNGVNLCEGSPVSIEVQADGSNLTYQWLKDGSVLAGETQSTLSIASLSAAEVGDYTVAVTGDCGTVTSNVADVLMIIAPAISAQPIDEAVCEGESVTLSADYDGQWFDINWLLDGNVIASAGDANVTTGPNVPGGSGTFELELSDVELSDAGSYTLEITGYCIGHDQVSDAATLTVNELPEPVITDNMGMLETGSGFDTYQWYLDGNILNGETSSTLTIPSNGDYTVEVSSDGCVGISAPYTVVTVSIADVNADHFNVYPNPFTANVNIDFGSYKESLDIQVIDMSGRIVHEISRTNSAQVLGVDLSSLKPGAYSLRFTRKDGTAVQQLLIKN